MTDTNTTGAYPIDPETPVGLLRGEIGDVNGVVHTGDATKADYQYVGDPFLAALIAAYPSNMSMALARALGSMATQMIAAATDIQVDDIRIKTVERANLMLQRAKDLESGALTWDADTAFEIVHLSVATGPAWRPEGTPWPSGYGYGPFGRGAVGESGF